MRIVLALLLAISLLPGCSTSHRAAPPEVQVRSVAIVPSAYEPAAQLDPDEKGLLNGGAVVGAAGGAGIGAMSAKASAGLLCTVSGPLCLVVMIPAAIVGGLVGGLAGGVADAVTTDMGGHIAQARGTIEQAVAEMRLTDALAAKTAQHTNLPVIRNPQTEYGLEVAVSELEFLTQEKEMALLLRARSRLYRTADGETLEERVSETKTEFRKYRDWAADGAQPLRSALDAAVADLSRAIVSERLGSALPRDTSARRGG